MNKYIICEAQHLSGYDAGNKAPSDVCSILESDGYQMVHINYLAHPRWYRPMLIPFYAVVLARYLKKCDIALFQHPGETFHNALAVINSLAITMTRNCRAKKVVLVHDINTLRFGRDGVVREIKALKKFDNIIVHSYEMQRYIEKYIEEDKIKVLGFFDYLVSKPFTGNRSFSRNVVFAGNLSKSMFLSSLNKSVGNVNFLLYGSRPDPDYCKDNLCYKGRFSSDDLSSIEGSWGLVWDGDSIENCSGCLGDYLRYNSPHKASLYVCASLPLIVPSSSAVASLVRQYGIGITVSSLYEINRALDGITGSAYQEMQDNIKELSTDLMTGNSLLNVLKNI